MNPKTVLGLESRSKVVPKSSQRSGTDKSVCATLASRAAGQKPVHDLTTEPLKKVRVGIIGLGKRNTRHLRDLLRIPFVEIAAVCDVQQANINEAVALCAAKKQNPMRYSGNERAWEKLIRQDNIDVVYIATPWEWHCEMSVKSMEAGKHAFVEVPAALTIAECWKLVDTSERTRRHCVMLENCCYGADELLVLNMARQGVFGTLVHAECGYKHDMRERLFNLDIEGAWRREYHKRLNGNFYPTHGLGPVAQYLGIGRGDQFTHLVSMSSREAGLSEWLAEQKPNGGRHARESYACGDMNTTLIRTAQGRTIMLQHDVVNPLPYSRVNALCGTHGIFRSYPARLALDAPQKYGLKPADNHNHDHNWLPDADFKKLRRRFEHPLQTRLGKLAKDSGHGGMNYVMSRRLLDCIRQGITPDITAYDAAAWSSIIELSCQSVAHRSAPVDVPDFTHGAWKKIKPLGIVTA